MEDKDLIALIGKKNGTTLDKTDPIFLTATIFEALAKEMMTNLAKIVTDAADQQATASVLAENNARARGQAMVTDGAKYGGDQIRAAGEAVATRLVNEVRAALELVAAEKRESRSMMRTSMAAAAVSVLAVMALISWQVWGPA